MKKIIYLLIFISIWSCKKDKEINSVDNYFKFKGSTHEIKTCSIEVINFPDNTKAVSIWFFDEEINYINSESIANMESLSGLSAVSFLDDIYDGKQLSGQYKIREDFNYCDVNIDYNANREDFNQDYSIESGVLSVLKIGNSYEFEFKCKTESNDSITGYYNGEVYQYESDQP